MDEAKERMSSWKAFRNEPEHRRMLVRMTLVCIELCIFAVKIIWIQIITIEHPVLKCTNMFWAFFLYAVTGTRCQFRFELPLLH